jgi:hypothetical protein
MGIVLSFSRHARRCFACRSVTGKHQKSAVCRCVYPLSLVVINGGLSLEKAEVSPRRPSETQARTLPENII